jgi:streptogramin lyase
MAEFSYVYIANSSQNTLSKINTREMVEEGRYYTRPDGMGSPSRTSVTVDARAVAVANRMGGVTKIWARPEYCEDKNQDGDIDTSTGPGDILPWDEEECTAWHTPFPGASTQRPVAWTSGTYNDETCEYEDQLLWTAASFGQGSGCDGTDGIYIYRLNGDTGDIEDEIHAPQLNCGLLGAYGAAVDHDGNAWFFIFGGGTTFRVDFETLEVTTHGGGFYGITVDTEGRPWTDAFARLNLDTMQWESNNDIPGAGGSGLVQDLQGRMWKSTTGGIGWVDMETLATGDIVPLPDNTNYRGIGVDVDGYIWAVPLGGTKAYKIHPDTYEYESIDGLVSPYTYSDMAGGQLINVTCNPPEG